jgi:hypothetical protein
MLLVIDGGGGLGGSVWALRSCLSTRTVTLIDIAGDLHGANLLLTQAFCWKSKLPARVGYQMCGTIEPQLRISNISTPAMPS